MFKFLIKKCRSFWVAGLHVITITSRLNDFVKIFLREDFVRIKDSLPFYFLFLLYVLSWVSYLHTSTIDHYWPARSLLAQNCTISFYPGNALILSFLTPWFIFRAQHEISRTALGRSVGLKYQEKVYISEGNVVLLMEIQGSLF